jgi:hypothetical protein
MFSTEFHNLILYGTTHFADIRRVHLEVIREKRLLHPMIRHHHAMRWVIIFF